MEQDLNKSLAIKISTDPHNPHIFLDLPALGKRYIILVESGEVLEEDLDP